MRGPSIADVEATTSLVVQPRISDFKDTAFPYISKSHTSAQKLCVFSPTYKTSGVSNALLLLTVVAHLRFSALYNGPSTERQEVLVVLDSLAMLGCGRWKKACCLMVYLAFNWSLVISIHGLFVPAFTYLYCLKLCEQREIYAMVNATSLSCIHCGILQMLIILPLALLGWRS